MSAAASRTRAAGLLLAAGVLLVCGCSRWFPVSIGDITKNPREYAGKTVTVLGTVENANSVLTLKYFEIRDTTGVIGVTTDRPMPRDGEEVRVTGVVHEAFSLGDKTVVVIKESSDDDKHDKGDDDR